EFHTPLNIIDGHAQRLIKTKERISTEEISERARKVRAAVLRMTHLIDNLLNSSRLIDDRAEHYFHPSEVDLGTVLHEVVDLHGGGISVDSREGEGSRFQVRLPRRAPLAPLPAAERAEVLLPARS